MTKKEIIKDIFSFERQVELSNLSRFMEMENVPDDIKENLRETMSSILRDSEDDIKEYLDTLAETTTEEALTAMQTFMNGPHYKEMIRVSGDYSKFLSDMIIGKPENAQRLMQAVQEIYHHLAEKGD